jgi:murein DD-endopeptidase MepM/ murein hydrolase activator NlpD
MDDFKSYQPNKKPRPWFSKTFNHRFMKNFIALLVVLSLIGGFVIGFLFLDISVDYTIPSGIDLFGIELKLPKIIIKVKNPQNSKIFGNSDVLESTSLPEILASEVQGPMLPVETKVIPEDILEPTKIPDQPTAAAAVTSTYTPMLISSSTATQSKNICSPIEGVELYELEQIISQAYDVPNPLSDLGHHGVDLGSYNFHNQYLYAIPIKAILDGRVAGIVVNRPPLGNTIILETKYSDLPEFIINLVDIQPGQSLYHLYAHLLNEPDVSIGTEIKCGQLINLLGKSQTVEAHLHLETVIAKSGLTVESMAFYDTSATEEELEQYRWWRMSGDFIPFDPMLLFLNIPEQ